jgi:hypothetical protein
VQHWTTHVACLTGYELHVLQLGTTGLKTFDSVEKHLFIVHLHVPGLRETDEHGAHGSDASHRTETDYVQVEGNDKVCPGAWGRTSDLVI